MKKGKAEEGPIPAAYDFTHARKNPYAERANRRTNIVVLEPDIYEVFPGSDEVNDALRMLMQTGIKAMQIKAAKAAEA